MKKLTLLVLAFAMASSAYAQDMFSKRGTAILPEEGDIAISIDASPLLRYAGNFFNQAGTNQAPGWAFTAQNPMTIYGRYFMREDMAIRGMFRLGLSSTTDKDVEVGSNNQDIELQDKASAFDMAIGGGVEFRRGLGRVQGYYGGDLLFMVNSHPDGNTTQQFVGVNDKVEEVTTKGGGAFGVGLRGVIGVEYFFAPKIALGGEFGWGVAFMSEGERVQSSSVSGVKDQTLSYGGSAFTLDNMMSGALKLSFFF